MDRKTAASIPDSGLPTIRKVEVFPSLPSPFRPGPFATKSGGELTVDFAFPPEIGANALWAFHFDYDRKEVLRTPQIISVRQYNVTKLPKGDTPGNIILGGTEFHRIRQEIVMCTAGQVSWTCEDAYGEKLEQILTPGIAVWMPPFILHTYQSLENGSALRVVCNTLYDPDNPESYDTFSEEIFRELQANCA